MARVVEGPVWAYVLPDDLDLGGVSGKWVYHAVSGRLVAAAGVAARLIDIGIVPAVKYARGDPLGRYGRAAECLVAGRPSVLCLYSRRRRDPRTKLVFEALTGLFTLVWCDETSPADGGRGAGRRPLGFISHNRINST
jgi:hypothetical protein